jgi:hypothetical protein
MPSAKKRKEPASDDEASDVASDNDEPAKKKKTLSDHRAESKKAQKEREELKKDDPPSAPPPPQFVAAKPTKVDVKETRRRLLEKLHDAGKPTKASSAVWKFLLRVTEKPGKVVCLVCESEFSDKGGGNINKHMRLHVATGQIPDWEAIGAPSAKQKRPKSKTRRVSASGSSTSTNASTSTSTSSTTGTTGTTGTSTGTSTGSTNSKSIPVLKPIGGQTQLQFYSKDQLKQARDAALVRWLLSDMR